MKKVKLPLKDIPKIGPFLAWNSQMSERDYMGLPCIDYHFFMRYNNVDDLIEQIDDLFINTSFGGGVIKDELLRQNMPGGVNEYLLIKYSSPRKPENLNVNGLGLVVLEDENLKRGHKKHKTIKDYAKSIIGVNQ